MNTDDLDSDAYRRWWESIGREDLTACPCGEPVESWATDGDPPSVREALEPGFATCPRHRGQRRETMAQAIIAGTFGERDLTEAELDKAQRVADGRPPYDA
jgi:hypothetical protein